MSTETLPAEKPKRNSERKLGWAGDAALACLFHSEPRTADVPKATSRRLRLVTVPIRMRDPSLKNRSPPDGSGYG